MSNATTLHALQAIAILEQAAASAVGLVVKVRAMHAESLAHPAIRGRQVLARFRRECAPRFDHIQINLGTQEPDTLILINKNAKKD